jgi:hypothetical protein
MVNFLFTQTGCSETYTPDSKPKAGITSQCMEAAKSGGLTMVRTIDPWQLLIFYDLSLANMPIDPATPYFVR